MFNKLKKILKSEKEQNSRNHGSEIVRWEILPNNPAKIGCLKSSDPKHTDIVFAEFLYDLLAKKGWNVQILKSNGENKWLHIPENGYYLLPLLNWVDNDEEGKYRVATTIQIHHKELFLKGIFEYQYSRWSDELSMGIIDAFNSWIMLDWATLCDAANPENAENMNEIIEVTSEDKKSSKRHLFFGNMVIYPNFDVEKSEKAGIDVHPYIDEFCPCCFFTKSMEVFSKQMRDSGKSYAIRLFALKEPDGTLDADVRINGEEYPQAEEYLKKYAATWKNCDIIKFRKQYVIITDVKVKYN
ncbi:hypothetical protein EII29_08220 [Leptotrichia sp. OH3620_COT-345]|uniref:DUF6348 family protein n=1 Tax=Leptotrichia sp. OH3620_COT-345 TaxID=2491048 RepID=UPI000F6519BD|nr:DUF6348 family protein [Leptotrichia sp. OH3620_COT-345]RRD39218.1 hypothetical protein EII29_08220 [Leptotrichia sp. OH3620_COT-345]